MKLTKKERKEKNDIIINKLFNIQIKKESILGEQLSIYCYCDLIFYWKTMETAILQEYLIYNCFCCFDCFDYFHPTLQQRLFV